MSDEADDTRYSAVLRALSDLVGTWKEYQTQITAEIIEYKKTVNSALSVLAMESLKFQGDTAKRLEDDAVERRARQAHVDMETQNVRRDMLSARAETLARLDETTKQNEAHEHRASRKSLVLLGGMGCLLMLNVAAILLLAVALAVMYWTR